MMRMMRMIMTTMMMVMMMIRSRESLGDESSLVRRGSVRVRRTQQEKADGGNLRRLSSI